MNVYRYAIAANIPTIVEISQALKATHPEIAEGLADMVREIQDSEVDVHGPYRAKADEPRVGMCRTPIEFMTAYREKA